MSVGKEIAQEFGHVRMDPRLKKELAADIDDALAAQSARIAELENEAFRLRVAAHDRSILESVLVDTASELDCEPDNEEILFAITKLKDDNKRLKDALTLAANGLNACSAGSTTEAGHDAVRPTLVAGTHQRASELLMEAAEFFAATFEKADERAWRALLTYCPAELIRAARAALQPQVK